MRKHFKPLTRLLMTLLMVLIGGAPLMRASVTVDIKAPSAPYVYAYYNVYENDVPTKIEPLGAWPGTHITATKTNIYGETRYRVFFQALDESQYAVHPSIILHNGNGQQTGDITLYNAGDTYTRYYDIEYDGATGYQYIQNLLSGGYSDYELNWTQGLEVTDNHYRVWYAPRNNGSTTYNYVYAWDDDVDPKVKYSGEWPGSPMTACQDANGNTYYTYDFGECQNGAPDHVIFVDYDGENVLSQTGNLAYHANMVYVDSDPVMTVKPKVEITSNLFPDEVIRKVILGDSQLNDYLYYDKVDTDGDGKLSTFEVYNTRRIGLRFYAYEDDDKYKNLPVVSTLQGLDYFPALEQLQICYPTYDYPYGNMVSDGKDVARISYENYGYSIGNLGNLSLENLPQLTYVELQACGITSIDLTKNSVIYDLNLEANKLESVNVGNMPNLRNLRLSSNQLSTVDVSNNQKLYHLTLALNPLTTSFAPNCSSLEWLTVSKCGLNSIDLSLTPNIKHLDADWNNLASINLTPLSKLFRLNLDYNNLTSVNLPASVFANTTDRVEIAVSHNDLTALDLSNVPVLSSLEARNNKLTSITFPTVYNGDKGNIDISNNLLTSIDVSSYEDLDELNCTGNQIETIAVHPNLRYLYCGYNRLSSLDMSANTSLRYLYVNNNQLNENTLILPPDNISEKPAPRRAKTSERAKKIRKSIGLKDDGPSRGLTYLNIGCNEFNTFDFSPYPTIGDFTTAGNHLTALDLSMLVDIDQEFNMEGVGEFLPIDYDKWLMIDGDALYAFQKSNLWTTEEVRSIINDELLSWLNVESFDDLNLMLASLGSGNTREVTPEWAQKAGEDIYFIRLDNAAAGSKELLTENTFLGPDFVMENASNWNNAEVVNDPTFGNILKLTKTGGSGDTATGEVSYTYDTGCEVDNTEDLFYKNTTFQFTWTAPATPTVAGDAVTLSPNGGVYTGNSNQVTVTANDGSYQLIVNINGNEQTYYSNTATVYLPTGGEYGECTVTVTPVNNGVAGTPVTTTYTYMPSPECSTKWLSVEDIAEVVAGKQYTIGRIFSPDKTEDFVSGMSVAPYGADYHARSNLTVTATYDDETEHYNFTLPQNADFEMFTLEAIDGVATESTYYLKSETTGKYLVFDATTNALAYSTTPAPVYIRSRGKGYIAICNVDDVENTPDNLLYSIYENDNDNCYKSYNDVESSGSELKPYVEWAQLFKQEDVIAPEFDKPTGSVLRYGTRVENVNWESRATLCYEQTYVTVDGSDPITSETRMRYKDFVLISSRYFEELETPNYDGTITIKAVNYSGYKYSDVVTANYTVLQQTPHHFKQVTSADELVEGKFYSVVALLHDKDGDDYRALGEVSSNGGYDACEISMAADGTFDIIPYYEPSPLLLGLDGNQWYFIDDMNNRVTFDSLESFDITFNGDANNSVTIDYGGVSGLLYATSKPLFKLGSTADLEGDNNFRYLMLYIEAPFPPKFTPEDGSIYTDNNNTVTINLPEGSDGVSVVIDGGDPITVQPIPGTNGVVTVDGEGNVTITMPTGGGYEEHTVVVTPLIGGASDDPVTGHFTYVKPGEAGKFVNIFGNEMLVPGETYIITNHLLKDYFDEDDRGVMNVVSATTGTATMSIVTPTEEAPDYRSWIELPAGHTADEFTLEHNENDADNAFYLRSRLTNNNNEALYLNLSTSDDEDDVTMSLSTTPQLLYINVDDDDEKPRACISNNVIPAAGEIDNNEHTRRVIWFNEDSEDPDIMCYEAQMAYEHEVGSGRWPYLYVKAERPEPPTFYPPYDLNINPNSEQMGVSISCPSGSGDLKLVYVRDDEQGDHKLDYGYEYITLPQDHGVGIEAYSCDSRFFIFSDAANWASHYYSVVVPNPTYNPAPGEYLANQLRVTLSQANGDDIYVNAHRQGYPSTIDPANGEGAKYTGPMILDDVTWYVIAYAEDANGNRSEVVPGRYSIRTPMPFNFYRVKSNDEIKPGREYIAVYRAPSDYYGMTQQDVNGKRGYIPNDYSVLTDPSSAIMGGLVYLVEDEMAYVNKPIVSIFGLGEKDANNKYTLYDFNAGAYVNAAEGTFATVATTDAATTHFSISIDEQSNNYDASITTDGKILVFNTTDNTFAFEDENVVADNLMPVTLYWRPNSHMTLKELKETLADGDPDNPADDDGGKEREVTISDPLVVAYVARPKVADEATIIVLRDNAEATEGILEKGPNQKSLLIKGVNDKYVNTVPQEEYTQNNWIAVLMPYNADDYEVGQTIKGGTLHGYIEGDKLLIMAFNAQRQPEIDLTADPVDVVYNTYIPANFNSSYWNQDSEYFMMMPKPIEVFNMTYALYSEGGMFTPDDGGVQTLGMTGGVDVYAIGLYTNGKLPSGQAIGVEDSNETLFAGMENQEFEFQGVILPNGFLDDDEFDEFENEYGDGYVMYNYGTDQATGQAGKPAPRRYNANTSNKYGGGGVLLLDIDASDQGTITGITEIRPDRNVKVKSVRYYNVAGMVSDKPFDGVNIIVTEMTDGTRVTTKEIK